MGFRFRKVMKIPITALLVGAILLTPGWGSLARPRRAEAATTYTVRKGDTLSGIAARYRTSVKHLQSWNRLKTTMIRIGQRLIVAGGFTGPAASYDRRLIHRVAAGESLDSLSLRYGVTVDEIGAANGRKPANIGTSLVIPYPTQPSEPLSRDPGLPGSLVAGYYVKSSLEDALSSSTVREYGDSLDLLVFASHRVRSDGSIDGLLYPDQAEASAASEGRFLLMFTNLNEGRFNRELVHGVLRDPEVRKRAVAGILETVTREKALGADIDFESVPPEDRRYYSQFMRELAAALHPAGFMVTASVPAKLREDPSQGWSGAYDYPLLARICDLMFVMAYDQHYSTGYAGPVAGIDWVQAVVDYSVTAIPAEKMVLGIPSYGYDWRVGQRGARAVPAFRALEMAVSRGARVDRHAEGQVPFFSYKEGRVNRVVFFEDAASLASKMELVNRLGLRGIVMWRLGYEDPAVWQVVGS